MLIYYPIDLALLGGGGYLMLLGMGKLSEPARLKGSEEIAILGRVLIFLGVLMSPTLLGFTFTDIKGWLEDIWTSGGGMGTG